MSYKAIFFLLLMILGIAYDLMVSDSIDSFKQPTLAIFSSEKTIGGHCSFEVKLKSTTDWEK